MGRRQQVIQESAEKLQSEGLEAIGVQVILSKMCHQGIQQLVHGIRCHVATQKSGSCNKLQNMPDQIICSLYCIRLGIKASQICGLKAGHLWARNSLFSMMYMYVYMCIYVYVHVCVYVCMHVHVCDVGGCKRAKGL